LAGFAASSAGFPGCPLAGFPESSAGFSCVPLAGLAASSCGPLCGGGFGASFFPMSLNF